MLTNVQVMAGATSVARFDDIVVWFETGPQGGGVMLTQLLQAVQGVSTGSVPSRQLGARLAGVLNTGDAKAVPAMVAATPEDGGLRVVVHGWGAVVADGIHLPNGWVDQVIADRTTFFLGRNTVTPMAPVDGSPLDLEDGVVPGDGVSFALEPSTPADAADRPEPVPAAPEPEPGDAQAAAPSPAAGVPHAAEAPDDPPPPSDRSQPATPWPPPGAGPPRAVAGPAAAPPVAAAPQPPAPQPFAHPGAAPSTPGRLVLDDGSTAALERTCVLGSAPHGSPAVQTGVALPLAVSGQGVAPIHAEIRVEQGQVAVRDLGGAPTYLLLPGAASWTALAPGQISQLAPGTRVALGQRTISYERP